jgi:hypothetical protein
MRICALFSEQTSGGWPIAGLARAIMGALQRA